MGGSVYGPEHAGARGGRGGQCASVLRLLMREVGEGVGWGQVPSQGWCVVIGGADAPEVRPSSCKGPLSPHGGLQSWLSTLCAVWVEEGGKSY